MGKTITLTTKDGQKYILEYTRKTVKEMEADGFNLEDLTNKPMLTLPRLFEGAFLAHHRYTKRETVESIFKGIGNREELFTTLVEMYRTPINALWEEPEESEKNVGWEVSE